MHLERPEKLSPLVPWNILQSSTEYRKITANSRENCRAAKAYGKVLEYFMYNKPKEEVMERL